MSDLKEIITRDLFITLPANGGKLRKFVFDRSRNSCLDVRVNDWPLMQSVIPTVLIVAFYILFIIFGQQWMKKRKAFELREFMFVYNIVQVVLCAYITYEVGNNNKNDFLIKYDSINSQLMYGLKKGTVYFVNRSTFPKALWR